MAKMQFQNVHDFETALASWTTYLKEVRIMSSIVLIFSCSPTRADVGSSGLLIVSASNTYSNSQKEEKLKKKLGDEEYITKSGSSWDNLMLNETLNKAMKLFDPPHTSWISKTSLTSYPFTPEDESSWSSTSSGSTPLNIAAIKQTMQIVTSCVSMSSPSAIKENVRRLFYKGYRLRADNNALFT